jgi:hypothetical protein
LIGRDRGNGGFSKAVDTVGLAYPNAPFAILKQSRPGTVMGNSTFGVITASGSSQQNQPRLIQLALRINF